MHELIALEKIAQWEKLKALVLDSVSSPITKRVYNMALNEFMAWFQQAPRPGFTKATVSAWRVSLAVWAVPVPVMANPLRSSVTSLALMVIASPVLTVMFVVR